MYILNDAYQYFEEKNTPYMYKVQNLSVVTYVHHRFFLYYNASFSSINELRMSLRYLPPFCQKRNSGY